MAAAPAYFDTSVLLKRYINEPGSVRAREALRRFKLVCSAIAPVEATSMVGRRLRSGELSEPAARAILNRLHDDRAQWELVEVQPAVLDRAENLVFDVGVATLDALHIASALVFASEVGRRVSFVTADARQRAAATRVKLEVVWVG
jgi:predicted nucleic acid-binding protein